MDSNLIPITRQAPTVTQKESVESKYPTEIVDLPSGGYFYPENHPLSSGKVELKMMTAKEEDILTNSNLIKSGIVLDRLLESVLINKNIKPSDFFVGDKNAIFIALRRLAYGDNYGPLSIKCNSCKEDNREVEVNLGEIKTKEYDFSKLTPHDNKFEYTLPFSKKVVIFKLLTSKEESDIENEIKVATKLKLASSELTTRLKHTLYSVDNNTDPAYIRKFIENELLSKDSFALRKYMREVTPNIDLTFNFTCTQCGAEERIGLPLTATFFWPDTAG